MFRKVFSSCLSHTLGGFVFDDSLRFQDQIKADYKPFSTKPSIPDTANMKRALSDAEKKDRKNLKAGGPFLAEKKAPGKREPGHYWWLPSTMEKYFH